MYLHGACVKNLSEWLVIISRIKRVRYSAGFSYWVDSALGPVFFGYLGVILNLCSEAMIVRLEASFVEVCDVRSRLNYLIDIMHIILCELHIQ